jgi:hypothetical protein
MVKVEVKIGIDIRYSQIATKIEPINPATLI